MVLIIASAVDARLKVANGTLKVAVAELMMLSPGLVTFVPASCNREILYKSLIGRRQPESYSVTCGATGSALYVSVDHPESYLTPGIPCRFDRELHLDVGHLELWPCPPR
jgi:hypothetical protein